MERVKIKGYFIQGAEDGQWSYNVILRRFQATIVAVKKQYLFRIMCVFVDLGIQRAMPMCYIVVCGLSGSTILFNPIPIRAKFSTYY